MSRYSGGNAYSFHIRKLGEDFYRLSWKVDRYYSGSRLRYPRQFERDTDEKGARRFAKKHELDFDKWFPTGETK